MNPNERIAVSNAGVIILWPFLSAYFARLGLTENNLFLSTIHQNRAVYLLQYLVYNSVNFSEYDLPLNKILVGMDLTSPVKPISPVTQDEKSLSASLLEGLKQNWPQMHSSSPLAIQETFFIRDGLLTLEDENVTVSVEKRGVDILLQSIPWNLSMINLPWIAAPLRVAWSY